MFFSALFGSKKKNIREKVRFFDKNNGLTPLQNVVFFRLCENFTFPVSKAFFTIQNIKKCFFLAFSAHKNRLGKRPFFKKNHGLTPLQNVDFLNILRTSLLWSKKHSFL